MPRPDLTLTPAGPALAPRYRAHPDRPVGLTVQSRNPYLRLFAIPGARAFTVGNMVARLPVGMFGISAVIMVAARYDSYALAGAVTATALGAGALTGPWIARLIDRYGQARVAVPASVHAVLGRLLLVLLVALPRDRADRHPAEHGRDVPGALGPSAAGRPGRPAHRQRLRAGR